MGDQEAQTLSPSLFSPHWKSDGECLLIWSKCDKDCTSCVIAGNPAIVQQFYLWYYAEEEEVETEEEALEREERWSEETKEEVVRLHGLLDEMVSEAPASSWTKDMVKFFCVEHGFPFTDHEILYGGIKRRAAKVS